MEFPPNDVHDFMELLFPPRGMCQLCQKLIKKRSMEFHLGECLEQHRGAFSGKASPKYLLLIEESIHPDHYWLYLEMKRAVHIGSSRPLLEADLVGMLRA